MVVTAVQSGTSGKPWFAWRNYVTRGNVVAQFEDVLHPAPVCGALAAGYLTEPFVHYLRAIHFPLPPDDGSNVAMHAGVFLVGVCGMWISDAVFELISRRLRGK